MARGLGKGLSSLIPEPEENNKNEDDLTTEQMAEANNETAKRSVAASGINDRIVNVAIDNIAKNPSQPRHKFNPDNLRELADSILEHGILQPLVVTQVGQGYELISGERRLQASAMAGLETVPVIIRAASEQEKLELALVENIQRSDLNPIEEAKAYAKLEDEFSLTQENVAKRVGKSRSAIANSLRLLTLPEEIQKALYEEVITEGHAKAILGLKSDQDRLRLFQEILAKGTMSVRQVESEVKKVRIRSHNRQQKDPKILDLEESLQRALGTKVQIAKRAGKGKIVIDFFSNEELETIANKISYEDDL